MTVVRTHACIQVRPQSILHIVIISIIILEEIWVAYLFAANEQVKGER